MIGAIVLAAGASSRMGVSKASLTTGPGGPTFLESIRDALREAGVRIVRVVVATEGAPGEETVLNSDPSRGMLSSVQCGLRALPPVVDAVLVWPVDHPFVTAATVTALIDSFLSARPPIVVPTFGGRRGHPVLFAWRVVPELLAADLNAGARAVVHAHPERLDLAVGDPGIVADIDTPEDYRRILGADPAARSEAS